MIGLACGSVARSDSSGLRDALGEPLCPRALGRQRRGAACLSVLAESHCFPLPVVGSLVEQSTASSFLAQLHFCTKMECPGSPSVCHIPTRSLKPCVCVCRAYSWKGTPRFSCAVPYEALSVFSWLDEFAMDYQTGFLKKEKNKYENFPVKQYCSFYV